MKSENRPRVIVCGTRTFADKALLYEKMDRYTVDMDDPIICTGAGRYYVESKVKGKKSQAEVGADWFAEQWAMDRGFTLKRFHPDFEKNNSPAAFHIRNREMVEYAAERKPAFCVAFHDGKSPGTKSVIELCRKRGFQVRVVRFQEKS